MPTKTKEKQTWTVPEEHQGEARRLAKADSIARIISKCADKRLEMAIDEGDAGKAVAAYEEGLALEAAAEATHDALWDHIHEAIPELERGEDRYKFNPDDCSVKIHGGRNPLAAMFSEADD